MHLTCIRNDACFASQAGRGQGGTRHLRGSACAWGSLGPLPLLERAALSLPHVHPTPAQQPRSTTVIGCNGRSLCSNQIPDKSRHQQEHSTYVYTHTDPQKLNGNMALNDLCFVHACCVYKKLAMCTRCFIILTHSVSTAHQESAASVNIRQEMTDLHVQGSKEGGVHVDLGGVIRGARQGGDDEGPVGAASFLQGCFQHQHAVLVCVPLHQRRPCCCQH